MRASSALNLVGSRLHRLPLAIVYVTERCNSRCVTCEFWRARGPELQVCRAERLARELEGLGTEAVLLTGGEVLLHSSWRRIAETFRLSSLRLWLATAGLALAREADAVASLCDRVTVSLDGATRASYRRIRGIDAFDEVVAGIGALVARGTWVSLRVTVQRENYTELPTLVRLAKRLGVREISFLPVDVSHPSAFGREGPGESRSEAAALGVRDLPVLARVLDELEVDFAEDLASGFIAETPEKLRALHAYFAALCGRGPFPPVRCNAPRFSAVVRADGRLQPCHFIESSGDAIDGSLRDALNGGELRALRRRINRGELPECRACVCPMWRSPRELLLGRWI